MRLLRGQELDASSAHAVEAVRLAEALAAVRGLGLPGIEELREVAVALLGGGYAESLQIMERGLIIGEKLGKGRPASPPRPCSKTWPGSNAPCASSPSPSPGPWPLAQITDLAGASPAAPAAAAKAPGFDWTRAVRVLPMLRELVGA